MHIPNEILADICSRYLNDFNRIFEYYDEYDDAKEHVFNSYSYKEDIEKKVAISIFNTTNFYIEKNNLDPIYDFSEYEFFVKYFIRDYYRNNSEFLNAS